MQQRILIHLLRWTPLPQPWSQVRGKGRGRKHAEEINEKRGRKHAQKNEMDNLIPDVLRKTLLAQPWPQARV